MPKYYFRCRSNPKGPLLVLETKWEATEMKTHPDYDEVDQDGIPVVPESEREEPPILFAPAGVSKPKG